MPVRLRQQARGATGQLHRAPRFGFGGRGCSAARLQYARATAGGGGGVPTTRVPTTCTPHLEGRGVGGRAVLVVVLGIRQLVQRGAAPAVHQGGGAALVARVGRAQRRRVAAGGGGGEGGVAAVHAQLIAAAVGHLLLALQIQRGAGGQERHGCRHLQGGEAGAAGWVVAAARAPLTRLGLAATGCLGAAPGVGRVARRAVLLSGGGVPGRQQAAGRRQRPPQAGRM